MMMLIWTACWLFLWQGKVEAFAPAIDRSPPSSSLFASATTAPTTVTATPRIWDFEGHSCYSEVATANGGGNLFDMNNNNKPDVLLIHGFGCSTVYWRETTNYLANAGYTVHALDLLGQGKSAKPGRAQGIEYSINLWAQMVDAYAKKYIPRQKQIVVMGNSLGSVVALSAATGDFGGNDGNTSISSRIQGICMYNCGIGMNSRNLVKEVENPIQRVLFTFLFDVLDTLIFDNVPLLTYVLNDLVTKDLLRNALTGLYQYAKPDPSARVDDTLVDSFYRPAKEDGSVEALNQIYTNDAGKTPMEFHQDYPLLENVPIHLVWGSEDQVTPLAGSVGQFYTELSNNDDSKVSIKVVEAGHIPFDEIPECNESVVQWMDQVVCKQRPSSQQVLGGFQWPSFGQ
jgi:pimeloyl-ACP methyl ester carboxylesterase